MHFECSGVQTGCAMSFWMSSWPHREKILFLDFRGSGGQNTISTYACLLLCFMLMLASLILDFAMFGGFCGLNHLGGISECRVAPCVPFLFLLRAMLYLPCLFVPPIGFLCIFTRLLTCPCLSLAC